jgi:hypothetical protein
MKSKIYSILTVVALLTLGVSMSSFTANSSTFATEVSADGDCDKCKDAKCDGSCDKQEHKCTEDCKKDGKCTHAPADHKCTDACKKDGNCTHKSEAKKETVKKSCGEKKSCGNHKGCGKH